MQCNDYLHKLKTKQEYLRSSNLVCFLVLFFNKYIINIEYCQQRASVLHVVVIHRLTNRNMLHFIDFLVIFLLETNGLKKYLAKIGNGIIIIDYVVDIFLLMTIKPRAWIRTLEGE